MNDRLLLSLAALMLGAAPVRAQSDGALAQLLKYAPGPVAPAPDARPAPQAGYVSANGTGKAIEWVSVGKKNKFDWVDPATGDDFKGGINDIEISKALVTVGQYGECVSQDQCAPPGTGDGCNWGKPGREDEAVNCVDRSRASQYADFVHGRLPTLFELAYARTMNLSRPQGPRPDSPFTELAMPEDSAKAKKGEKECRPIETLYVESGLSDAFYTNHSIEEIETLRHKPQFPGQHIVFQVARGAMSKSKVPGGDASEFRKEERLFRALSHDCQ